MQPYLSVHFDIFFPGLRQCIFQKRLIVMAWALAPWLSVKAGSVSHALWLGLHCRNLRGAPGEGGSICCWLAGRKDTFAITMGNEVTQVFVPTLLLLPVAS